MFQMLSGQKQVLDLVQAVDTGSLLLKPPFQRRSVWTPSVKGHFIDTVLKGLPFPEIFIVTGLIDPDTRRRVDHLVDGQQRVSTLREYVNGSADIAYRGLKPFAELDKVTQVRFLSYPVTVRDLVQADSTTVADIFDRINSTDFSLKATERFNARFMGQYKRYCEALAEHPFFRKHRTFSYAVWKRMGDVTFCLTLVTTLLAGYFRREELLEDYLTDYNDDFPDDLRPTARLESAFGFVEACNFPPKSRVWKKTDLFTLLVEHGTACSVRITPDPVVVGPKLAAFYAEVDSLYKADPSGESAAALAVRPEVLRYMKAATKATNDKYARVDRSEVISAILATLGPPKSKRK